ncbi:porin [Candidatus Steffania adelgidicola]|uniref:porin n=1 Tax=Candidatus Steffania adelgidicola TaxID=1076626 RepID=UPI001D00BBF7|nr:porin [Candidatus Steffania adelgidicola]UDG79534.1 Outer membrane protein C [Candidatus Steffania adelgidicola]
MKLQSLSVLVSAMVMVGSTGAAEVYHTDSNRLDLYGELNGIRYISADEDKNGDGSFVCYGLRGETQFGENLIGFGTFEQEVKLTSSPKEERSNHFSRLGFVGFKLGDLGSIDYGRNFGVLYDIGRWTYIMPEFGGDTSINDNFLSSQANGVFTYRNSDFFGMLDGFNFALQYQGNSDSKVDKDKIRQLSRKANGDGYGLALTYNLNNGLSISSAYTSSNRTLAQRTLTISSDPNQKAEAYSFGLKYDAYNLYLAALYSETKHMTPYGDFSGNKNGEQIYGFAEKLKNLEVVAQYQFDFGFRPSVGYLQSQISDNNEGKTQNIKKYIAVGASYNLNKNILSFVNYRVNLLAKGDFIHKAKISTDNIIALGMTYIF